MQDEQGGVQPFEPPFDETFQELLAGAVQGKVPVYGVVQELDKVSFKRAHSYFRPELTEEGQQVVRDMAAAWNAGRPAQPWLYVRDGAYIVADDYFWLALVEQGRPPTFAAQVLGEPLSEGLVQKVALDQATVRRMLGL